MEVYHNGEWGTVCDDGWDLNDAQVVCNELRLGNAAVARQKEFYGQGSGTIWLDNLECVGTERTVGNCSHNGWGNHDCSHSEDAGVRCATGKFDYYILLLFLVYKSTLWVAFCSDRHVPITTLLKKLKI